MSELKPCPFCGGSAIYKTKSAIDDFLGTQTVSCRECCCSAPLHNWNIRTESTEREQLHSLFERVSGCEISDFDESQLPYLADMIEGQMDANEGCIEKLRKERDSCVKQLRRLLRNQAFLTHLPIKADSLGKFLAKLNQQGE